MFAVRLLKILSFSVAASLGQPDIAYRVAQIDGDSASRPANILYFAEQNNGHHFPEVFMSRSRKAFGERSLKFATTVSTGDLNLANLANYDGVFFFGNHNVFPLSTQNEILAYANAGGGISGMHVASYAFRNDPIMRELLGGAFLGHGAISEFTQRLIKTPEDLPQQLENNPRFPFSDGGTYQTDLTHPIVLNLPDYTSSDEPYLHIDMATDITLLGYREDSRGWDEPYTWIRHQGAGRVFYHANGHNADTWDEENFIELMARGIGWTAEPTNLDTFQSFQAPVLSADGGLQYLAQLNGAPGSKTALYTREIQSGIDQGSTPSGYESLSLLIDSSTPHAIADDTTIAMAPQVLDPSSATQSTVLYVGHQAFPSTIATAGGSANSIEAGFFYSQTQSFPFRLSEDGFPIYFASIEDSAGGNQKNAFITHNGSRHLPIVIEGDPFPGIPGMTVSQLHPDTFTIARRNVVSFLGDATDGLTTETHLMVGNWWAPKSWMSTGTSHGALPANTTISGFESIGISFQNNISFLGEITGPGTNNDSDQILARANSTGGLTLLFKEGDSIDGIRLTFPAGLPKTIHTSDRDLIHVLTPTGAAILACPHSGSPSLLIREGSSLDIDGTTWQISSLSTPQLMATSSELAIPATLSLPGMPATTIEALLYHGRTGVRVLAAEGWTVPTEAGDLTISSIACTTGANGTSGLTENSSLAFTITATDGHEAIVLLEDLNDLDQDGAPDTLELAFGGDPTLSSDSIPPGLPIIKKVSSNQISISYWHHTDPNLAFVYEPYFSHNLENWLPLTNPFLPAADQTGIPSGFQLHEATLAIETQPFFVRFVIR